MPFNNSFNISKPHYYYPPATPIRTLIVPTLIQGRRFANASASRGDLTASFANSWNYTQAWTIATWINPQANTNGAIFAKQQGGSPFAGFSVITAPGTSQPKFAINLQNTGTNEIFTSTTTEFVTGSWYHVVFTYDGSGLAAGCHVFVNGSDQTLTASNDTLATNSILTNINAQIGARGGSGSATLFLDAGLRRTAVFTRVLNATERAMLDSGNKAPTDIPSCSLWTEFGPYNDGNTMVADWSGNGNTLFISGTVNLLTGPTGSFAPLLPTIGITGPTTLAGPLAKNIKNPIMVNIGFVTNGAYPVGTAGDQIGPQAIYKRGDKDYILLTENVNGLKTLDTGNQPGAFDFDTPSIAGTSTDGTNWTFQFQGSASFACFNVLNLTGSDAAFKARVRGESSVSAFFFDPDDGKWKAYFHGGNNSSPRQIYFATCPSASNPLVAGNWTLQNSGSPVIGTGSVGTWEVASVADGKVVRINSASMVMLYHGTDGNGVPAVGVATSTDKGFTWTKSVSNPVIARLPGYTWNGAGIYSAGLVYDSKLGRLVTWCGGIPTGKIYSEGLGYYYADPVSASVWTAGAYNPVLTGDGQIFKTFEVVTGVVTHAYMDGSIIRMGYTSDNGVSGATGGRGVGEAMIQRLIV